MLPAPTRHMVRLVHRVLSEEGTLSSDWLAELQELVQDRQVDLDRVLAAAVELLTRRLDADRGTLYLVDHARRELVSRIAQLPEISEIRLRIGEGVAGWVAEHREVLNVPSGTEDDRFAQRIDLMTGYRTQSLLAAPIFDGEGVLVGVLQFLNKRAGVFTATDERTIAAMAERVGELLARTSLASQLAPGHRYPLFFRFNHIVGESPAMMEVYDRTARAAATEATVLIRGETGTGKELIAQAIHFNSARLQGPLAKVDCAALPPSLIENELFGHVRGAFTGADRDARGKVHAADGGTLFLDEIGELPLPVQGKLLRLLQDRTVLRVGGNEPESVDVRFVCATHRDLERLVAEGSFRQDLYYRLRVVEITMPPLRERGPEDLGRLIDHFLFETRRRHKRPGVTISPEARAALHAYGWPGNVRELEHCIESSVVLARGDIITPEVLPLRGAVAPGAAPGVFSTALRPLRDVEADYIRHVLDACGGNRTQAAQVLGIGRNTLLRKLQQD